MRYTPVLVDAVVASLLRISPLPADEPRKRISPTITFSKDEQTVTVKYDKGEWTFHRPVVSPWKYEVKGMVPWVDPQGDDANDGTAGKPVKTIGKALALAEAGDVIFVRPGTYIEHLLIKKSGEEGKPIILSCAPDALGRVKITPSKEYVEKNPRGAVTRSPTTALRRYAGGRHIYGRETRNGFRNRFSFASTRGTAL